MLVENSEKECTHTSIFRCTECPLIICRICGKHFMSLSELFWWKTVSFPMNCADHEGIIWRHPFTGQTYEEHQRTLDELYIKWETE